MRALQHQQRRPAVEWPTVAVAVAIYAGFATLTWFHTALPWPVVMALGGYLVAWHGSLQHEVVHGHPTRMSGLNELLVLPSLWLWLPYRLYRDTHLVHHRDDQLTDPFRDPESWYLSRERWARAGPRERRLLQFLNTAPGRLLLGPPVVVARMARAAAGRAHWGVEARRAWALHLLGCALVLAWTRGACGIPIGEYVLLYVYPAISLTLLRSFAEHEARPGIAERTLAVEAHPLLALLYLNNNLHPAHHARPETPWYRLPGLWARERARLEAAGTPPPVRGYAELLRRHLRTARFDPPWPLEP